MAVNDLTTEELKEEITNRIQGLRYSFSIFADQIHNKDVILFLGNTRSGKSTLVNYQIGTHLEGYLLANSRFPEFKVKAAEGGGDGPEIGEGSLSCTSLPGVYAIPGTETVAVDLPGFEDNRGVVQDIMNTLCIGQILAARSVKFILVADINDLTSDNVRNFTSVVEQAQELVSNFRELKNSFSLILTKDFRDYSQQEITEILQNKILNEEKLILNKELIKYWAGSIKSVGIFKKPTEEGPLSNALDVNVKGAIKECHSIGVGKCKIKPCLSIKAKDSLLEIYPEYTDTSYFNSELSRIITSFQKYFDIDKYVYASLDDELTETRRDLRDITDNLTKQECNYERLIEVRNSLNTLFDGHLTGEFLQSFGFVLALDKLSLFEERYRIMMTENYRNNLTEVKDKILALIEKIDDECEDRRSQNIKFTASCITATIGAAPAVVGLGRALDALLRAGNALKNLTVPAASAYEACAASTGIVATVTVCTVGGIAVGAGVAAAYVINKERYGKRAAARTAQGR